MSGLADTALLTVLQAGMLTTVQDVGRIGYLGVGLPAAGCLDTYSQQLANYLVGNAANVAVLEITLTGPELLFSHATSVGIVGASFDIYVNDRLVDQQQTIVVQANDRLRFGMLRQGCRAYLAIAQGFETVPVKGSHSTYLPAAIGGLNGGVLHKQDTLSYIASSKVIPVRSIPEALRIHYTQRTMLRVVDAAETHQFEAAQQLLYQQEFIVSPDSNRMGYRLLAEKKLARPVAKPMLTMRVVPGTIQVPQQGDPVLLLADAQTSGGYPRIAHIISADMNLAGQLKPGDKVRFFRVSLMRAQELYRHKNALLNSVSVL